MHGDVASDVRACIVISTVLEEKQHVVQWTPTKQPGKTGWATLRQQQAAQDSADVTNW